MTVFGWDHGVYQSAYALTDAYPGSAPELTAVLGTRIPRFYLRGGPMLREIKWRKHCADY